MDLIATLMFACLVSLFLRGSFVHGAATIYNVNKFGAQGNGKTDDSQAFQEAWEGACKDNGQDGVPTLVVPDGNFLLQSLVFHGPCKSNKVQSQLNGTIEAPDDISEWKSCPDESWISFYDIEGLKIDGQGLIDGHGSIWWDNNEESGDCEKPKVLHLHNCNNFHMSNINIQNSPKAHMTINQCNNVTISNIHITAPEDSPNTDGIDISESTKVNIKDSNIGTGDDCIAINGGCSDINITNVACGPGHGISIGSLGKDGSYDTVEDVNVRGCTFTGTQNGARIKTWPGGRGYARRISFDDITLVRTENPIIIDQKYNALNSETSVVEISDVTFRGFEGSSASELAIQLTCNNVKGCRDVIMDHVIIKSSTPGKVLSSACSNAKGQASDTTPPVPCLAAV